MNPRAAHHRSSEVRVTGALGVVMFLFASSADPPATRPKEPITVVVEGAHTGGVSASARALGLARAHEVYALSGSRVVYAAASLERSLAARGKADLLACTREGCAKEVARTMQADSVVVVTIARLGPTQRVSIDERDPFTFAALARASADTTLDDGDLVRTVGELAHTLAASTTGNIPTYGVLRVESVPAGLVVRIRDREVGKTPLTLAVRTGRHMLTVGDPKGGSVPADVVVHHREKSGVEVRLFEIEPPPTAEARVYQNDVAFGSYFYVAKMLIGAALIVPFTAAALYTGSLAGTLAPFVVLDIRRPDAWIFSAFVGLTLASVVVVVVGIALAVWGVVDMLDDPVPPLPPAMFHRVMVQTPTSTETFKYPVDDGTLGSPPPSEAVSERAPATDPRP